MFNRKLFLHDRMKYKPHMWTSNRVTCSASSLYNQLIFKWWHRPLSWFAFLQMLKTKNLVPVVYLEVISENYLSEQLRWDRQESQQSPQITCLWVIVDTEAPCCQDLQGHSWERSLCAHGNMYLPTSSCPSGHSSAMLPFCPSSFHGQGVTLGREGRKAMRQEDHLQGMCVCMRGSPANLVPFVCSPFFLFLKIFIYLDVPSLICGRQHLVPWPRMEPSPLHWERGVLATGPPGKSVFSFLNICTIAL